MRLEFYDMDELTFHVRGYRTESFPQGTILLREGDVAGYVYILKHGTVRVEAAGRTLSTLDVPGTIIGELSVILDAVHTASVECLTDCSFYVIKDFLRYLKKHPESINKLVRLMQKRLLNSTQRVIGSVPLELQFADCPIGCFETGEVVVKEGARATKMFILNEGALRIEAGGSEISQVTSTGSLVGELPFLASGYYTSTVTATEPTTLFTVDDVVQFYQRHPAAAAQLSRLLAARFSDVVDQFALFRSEMMRSGTQPLAQRLKARLGKVDELLRRDVTLQGKR